MKDPESLDDVCGFHLRFRAKVAKYAKNAKKRNQK